MESAAGYSNGLAEKYGSGANEVKNAVREVIAKKINLTLPKKTIQGIGILEADK